MWVTGVPWVAAINWSLEKGPCFTIRGAVGKGGCLLMLTVLLWKWKYFGEELPLLMYLYKLQQKATQEVPLNATTLVVTLITLNYVSYLIPVSKWHKYYALNDSKLAFKMLIESCLVLKDVFCHSDRRGTSPLRFLSSPIEATGHPFTFRPPLFRLWAQRFLIQLPHDQTTEEKIKQMI